MYTNCPACRNSTMSGGGGRETCHGPFSSGMGGVSKSGFEVIFSLQGAVACATRAPTWFVSLCPGALLLGWLLERRPRGLFPLALFLGCDRRTHLLLLVGNQSPSV